MPEKTPLNPVIHGKVERPGFTVEKVYFQSMPGHFVTGLLFRPADGKTGVKRPAVLCPHGHGGRLQDYGEKKIRQLTAAIWPTCFDSTCTPRRTTCSFACDVSSPIRPLPNRC